MYRVLILNHLHQHFTVVQRGCSTSLLLDRVITFPPESVSNDIFLSMFKFQLETKFFQILNNLFQDLKRFWYVPYCQKLSWYFPYLHKLSWYVSYRQKLSWYVRYLQKLSWYVVYRQKLRVLIHLR